MVRETLIFQAISYVHHNRNQTLNLEAPYQSFGVVYQNHFKRDQEADLTDNSCFLFVALPF